MSRIEVLEETPRPLKLFFRGLERYNFKYGVVRYDTRPISLIHGGYTRLLEQYGRISATVDLFLRFRLSYIVSFKEHVEFEPLCYMCPRVLKLSKQIPLPCILETDMGGDADEIYPFEFEVYTKKKITRGDIEAIMVPRGLKMAEGIGQLRDVFGSHGLDLRILDVTREDVVYGSGYRAAVEVLFCPETMISAGVMRHIVKVKAEGRQYVLVGKSAPLLLLGNVWDEYMDIHGFYPMIVEIDEENIDEVAVLDEVYRKVASIQSVFGYRDSRMVVDGVRVALSNIRMVYEGLGEVVMGVRIRGLDIFDSMSMEEKILMADYYISRARRDMFGV